jgi:hypothetical protein
MKLTTNMVIQICGIIVVVASALTAQQGVLSPKIAVIIGGVSAVAQAVAAYLGHISNVDGTKLQKP